MIISPIDIQVYHVLVLVQKKIQTLLKMIGRQQGRTSRLQIVFKCAFKNFSISAGKPRSFCFQIMERGHERLFKKADYARLRVAFDNGALSQATKTTNPENTLIKLRCKLSSKRLGDNVSEFIDYAICKLKR